MKVENPKERYSVCCLGRMKILLIIIFSTNLQALSNKYKRKKIKIEYEYQPQGYKDPETVVCQSSSPGSGSGGGTSVWGYLTAGVVAANVVANLVNNANENNNNNNNNDNQDNTNNNNQNIGNSANTNMNMNIIIPVPGGRSFDSSDNISDKQIHNVLCEIFEPSSEDVKSVSELAIKVNKIAFAIILTQTFQNFIPNKTLLLDFFLNSEC